MKLGKRWDGWHVILRNWARSRVRRFINQIARVSYSWWKIQSIIRRQSTSEGDTISLAGQCRMVICTWRRERVQRTRQTCWQNVLMLGNWGYVKHRLVFCSCCYRCCGAVKMLMMKIFFLRMYFLDDWVSLQVGELLGSGAWLILGFPIYSLF